MRRAAMGRAAIVDSVALIMFGGFDNPPLIVEVFDGCAELRRRLSAHRSGKRKHRGGLR